MDFIDCSFMKIIYNNIIPFGKFDAINLFGVLFVKKSAKPLSQEDINHEAIHTTQMKELGYIGFYLIYFFEWIYRLVTPPITAYKDISFEIEAYANESNPNYLDSRKKYAQWRK